MSSASSRLSRLAYVAVLGFALGFPGSAVHADEAGQVQNQLEASRSKLANLSARSQQAVLALQETQAGLAAARGELAAAQAQEAAAVARKGQIDAELVTAKQEEADGLARIAAIQAEQSRNTDIRNNIARQAYEGTGLERIAAVLNTGKAQQLADNMYVAEKVNDSQNALLDELAKQKAVADAEQAKLAETRRRIASLQLQAEAAVAQAVEAHRAAEQTSAQLAALESKQQAAAAAVAAQRGEEEQRVAQLQAESSRIQAELAARSSGGGGAAQVPPPQGSGRLQVPVAGPVTSEFGPRVNPVLGTSELHTGMDIGAPCGAPVHASESGTVIRAGVMGGYGNAIWVDHGGGLVTTYNHMSGYIRQSGSVNRGDLIGYVGTTGLSTGCHMHWEVRVNGQPVNPRGWF
ncbi:peptidase M23 family protein [Austwickia chelonae NBRC 105200]|uniref:Peptidase M23 family protein n=1 Tax=Austwickia chelonae NBRC 105200 TaxID=1184607 RepID=K6VSS0_9MICO|nr:peptidase M23 family protein [Austwickia chelonae NBRC 105200]